MWSLKYRYALLMMLFALAIASIGAQRPPGGPGSFPRRPGSFPGQHGTFNGHDNGRYSELADIGRQIGQTISDYFVPAFANFVRPLMKREAGNEE